MTTRVFSGVQPTGQLHLGNYLGAIRQFVALQDSHECIYCVVDLHAITVAHDPDALRRSTLEVAMAFVASGVDPQRAILFNQSRVGVHAELAWALNCVARMGWLNRMTQFKEKAGKHRENASVGLFTYPVLMAADILAYRSTHVPVGEDQRQHLELARDIARKFNTDFDAENLLPEPETLVLPEAARVMSLRDGSKKMSKSDPSEASRVHLNDDQDAIALKIRRATTDPDALPSEEKGLEGRLEAKNLVGIMAAITDRSIADVLKEYGGSQFSVFKPALTDALVHHLSPISAEMKRLQADPEHMNNILYDGAVKASKIAQTTRDLVYEKMGLSRPVSP